MEIVKGICKEDCTTVNDVYLNLDCVIGLLIWLWVEIWNWGLELQIWTFGLARTRIVWVEWSDLIRPLSRLSAQLRVSL
jgi:hypothetical protein